MLRDVRLYSRIVCIGSGRTLTTRSPLCDVCNGPPFGKAENAVQNHLFLNGLLEVLFLLVGQNVGFESSELLIVVINQYW